MKIKTKLYLGLALIVSIMLLLAFNLFHTLQQQKDFMDEIVTENYERLKTANAYKNETNVTAREVRQLILMEDSNRTSDEIIKQIALLNESRQNASVLLDTLLQYTNTDEEQRQVLASINYLNASYNDLIQEVIVDISNGNVEGATSILLDDTNNLRRNIFVTVDRIAQFEEEMMGQALYQSEETYQSAIIFLSILIVIATILVSAITFSVISSISKSIRTVRDVITTVPEQTRESLPRITVKTNDEIGDIGLAYNEMAAALEEISRQEQALQESLVEENWVKTRYSEIAEIGQGIQNINDFGSLFINTLAPIVRATHGVLYLSKNGEWLEKIASYAGEKEEIGVQFISIGEGLVGQCALDKQMKHLTDIPEGYVVIQSGIGRTTPNEILILPICFEGEVIGVLEVSTITTFDQLERKLLEQICGLVGASIHRILDHTKIQELLTESQTLTEELQAQSEELQQQQEELRLINEQLHEQYKQSDEKTKELEQIQDDLVEKNRNIQLSSKYKTEFLANMSHELRTPLNSMLILSQMLSENLDGNLTEKQQEHALTIYSSGKDLLDLINDILDLSKIESGKIDMYPEEIYMEDVKKFVERQFNPISKQKGLPFEIKIEQDAPTILLTDDQRLKQVLKNLLSNAFKFTKHGNVQLKISKGRGDESSKVVFSVSDTGIGIPKNKFDEIFEAFSQADGTTTREFGGTGLGLSISKELTSLLGGTIEVESTVGYGSTFTLHIPDYKGILSYNEHQLSNEAAATEELSISEHLLEKQDTLEESEHALLEGKKILVVDDDMRNIFALTTALETYKMKVLFAENGKEAIRTLAENEAIDIVLMDIMMPEMNGYEAMQEIRQNETWKDLPIIALTAKAMKNDREKSIQAGASDYISKPVNMVQLISLIKVWLYK